MKSKLTNFGNGIEKTRYHAEERKAEEIRFNRNSSDECARDLSEGDLLSLFDQVIVTLFLSFEDKGAEKRKEEEEKDDRERWIINLLFPFDYQLEEDD